MVTHSLSNQALGDCFKPYNVSFSLHTLPLAFSIWKPGDVSKYILPFPNLHERIHSSHRIRVGVIPDLQQVK